LPSDGGVKSAPPGKERDRGEVKALACKAVEGCVVRESIMVIFDSRWMKFGRKGGKGKFLGVNVMAKSVEGERLEGGCLAADEERFFFDRGSIAIVAQQ
jgi:hypothetical protein